MPVKVDTVSILKEYFSKVVSRADHHAPNVNEIIYTLLGVIILKVDPDSKIEVRGTDNSAMGNILWVRINGVQYAFRYEHAHGGSIEIREGNSRGPIKLSVTNSTSVQAILDIF